MFISKKAVIAGVSTLVLVGGAGALAGYSTLGRGTETITSATLDRTAITLKADLSKVALYPGVTAQVPIRARNTDRDVSLMITSIDKVPDADIDIVDPDDNCPREIDGEPTFGASTTSKPIPDVVIAPRESEIVGYLTVDMLEAAPDECQGVTLTIELGASAKSVAVPTPTPAPAP